MSVVQIFPRAEEPAAQALVNPVAGPREAAASSEKRPRKPAAANLPPASEPYPFDRAFHAMLARFTGGISPAALSLAWLDWSPHLAAAPQRQMEVLGDGLADAGRFMQAAAHATSREPWSVIR